MKALYWFLAAAVVGFLVYICIWLGDTQKTVPKITLSYFADGTEIAQAVEKRLDQEIGQNSFFWIGVEPEKTDQLSVVTALKSIFEKKNGAFAEVIVDSELKLPEDFIKSLQTTQNIQLKENLDTVGPVLEKLEQDKKRYLFVTASIYSNSFTKQNQIHQLKEKYKINPMTISLGYFSISTADENEATFRCSTEDKSGSSDWGCALVNKSRIVRRKYSEKSPKPWSGVMDLTGEKDYMFLLRKK